VNKALSGTVVAVAPKYLDNFCTRIKGRSDCLSLGFPNGSPWLQVSTSIWDNVATRQCTRIDRADPATVQKLTGFSTRVVTHERGWYILLESCGVAVGLVEPVAVRVFGDVVEARILRIDPILPFSKNFEKDLLTLQD
jgi:hypothetical protein